MALKHSIRTQLIKFILCLSIITSCSPLDKEQVRNLGIFVDRTDAGVIGLDGCTPIPVDDHYVLWTFGDTITGTMKKKINTGSTFEDSAVMKSMLSNSLAITPTPDDNSISRLHFTFYKQNRRPSQFLINYRGEDPGKVRFWAIDGIIIGRTLYMYYMKIFIIPGPSPEPFRIAGTGIARSRVPGSINDINRLEPERITLLFPENSPTYGDSIIRHNGTLFLTGHGKNPKAGMNTRSAFIAKVSPTEILERRAYSYLACDGTWTDTANSACGFFKDVAGELSLSYNNHLKKFIVIYCSLDGSIKLAQFSTFSEVPAILAATIYTPPKISGPSTRSFFYYSGKEIWSTKKAIYAIYMDPAIYKPMLIRIPYRVIREKYIHNE